MSTRSKAIICCVLMLLVISVIFFTLRGNQSWSSLPSKRSTVGIVNIANTLDPVFQGFKNKMGELGYVEADNITYLYDGATSDLQGLDPAVKKLTGANVDMILSISTPATMIAKKNTANAGIPVVFVPVTDPVASGIVESLSKPGGNITGIKVGGFVPQQFRWLMKISPGIKTVFIPHNSKDPSSKIGLNEVRKTAEKLGIDLRVMEFTKPDELEKILATIPQDIDAIFLLPDSLVMKKINDLVRVSMDRRLPMASVSLSQAKAGALLTYGIDFTKIGEQAARLADQILKGVKPVDLPVETAEFYLTLNLKTAKAIGIQIPDQILKQANTIIRD